MGEVFRARDTRLGRDVAIKVLPAALAQDTDRVTRFRREAQILATLNHPNIAGIYGLEEGNGTVGLVMELVAGDDLAQRLRGGAVPVEEAIAISKQIAEALEEAHAKGIVHRDLKPANVKVTPDGRVKVLDFGLAKALEGEASSSSSPGDVSHSPTMSRHMTEAGMIMGTAAYMSPEQARGKPVDKRADIWSFGVVLFEMLTGERLFSGETVSDVLAAVLTREPDWKAIPPATPTGLSRLLRRCLERDPKRRLHDIADARFDLEDSLLGSGDQSATLKGSIAAPPARPRAFLLGGALALTLFGVWFGGLLARRLDSRATPGTFHLATVLPQASDLVRQASGFALSPDGARVVFRHEQDGKRGLFIRPLDSLTVAFIPGTDEGMGPIFSPDGRSLAFFSTPVGSEQGGLHRIKVEGGAPLRLADSGTSTVAGFTFTGHWTEDGQILFSGSEPVIQRIPAAGGPVTAVTALDAPRGEQRHTQPRSLPGGRGVLYVAVMGDGRQDVMVARGDGSKGRVLVERAMSPAYSPTGHLLFVLETTLFAAPFDPDKLETTGAPSPVAEEVNVAIYGNHRSAKFALAQNGTLAYLAGAQESLTSDRTLVFVDRQGKATAAVEGMGVYLVPRLSPDGGRIAYSAVGERTGERDIWIADPKRGTRTRLTLGKGASTDPIWSPDGRAITFASTRTEGFLEIFSVPADGNTEPARLGLKTDRERALFPRAWLGGGSALLFHSIKAADDIGVWRKDSGTEEMLLATRYSELQPSLSPDERFMAYVSDESGRREVYVRDMTGSGRRVSVSSEGGDEPVWSPRGNEIFYRRGAQMIAVPVDAKGDLTLGAPSVLFNVPFDVDPFNSDATNYDVTKDGQRFLMVRRASDPRRAEQQLNVVVNWSEELKRLAGER